jgi:hypothetical protein
MPRYFYTDPLKAAQMTVNFGMRYENCDAGLKYCAATRGLIPDAPPLDAWSVVSDIFEAEVDHYNDIETHPLDKFYIHPDSLHLLKPQLGDLVTREHGVVGVVGTCFTHGPLGVFWAGSEGHHPLSGDEAVIQRNGIAFMWPESEEA